MPGQRTSCRTWNLSLTNWMHSFPREITSIGAIGDQGRARICRCFFNCKINNDAFSIKDGAVCKGPPIIPAVLCICDGSQRFRWLRPRRRPPSIRIWMRSRCPSRQTWPPIIVPRAVVVVEAMTAITLQSASVQSDLPNGFH